MSVTRIGISPLLGGGQSGSIALPEEITLQCPQCGAEAADKGNCLVQAVRIADPATRTGFFVRLEVDCRVCGCSDREPAIR